MNLYRIERIIEVEKDQNNEKGCLVKGMAIGFNGAIENPSLHGEIQIYIPNIEDKDFLFYKVRGKKKEKVKIDKPDRFVYVVKGWLKKKDSGPETENKNS